MSRVNPENKDFNILVVDDEVEYQRVFSLILSRNGFMFVYDLKSRGYIDKEKGQTLISEDLSGLAPLLGLEPRTP